MEQRETARRGARRLAGVTLALLGGLSAHGAGAQAPLPAAGADQHLGVVTCAGSTCHGATRPSAQSRVLQNEFVTWHREDKHAQAYKVLLNDRSRRIARNLGLEAAEKADICLDCHADNVPEALRGTRFQLSDGVGCEACHGGAERYLGPHLSADSNHENNLSLGMYPTEQPEPRARLCLSCHLGTKDKLATHRIMGAGHPRLSFELDTFSDIQPAHYLADADYRERKGAVSGTQVWVAGQLVAVRRYLDVFQEYQSGGKGLFPELFFFDCHGCHRSMRDPRWTPRTSAGLPPGSVRLNDAHLLMLRHVALVVAPEQRAPLGRAVAELHRATTQGMPATLAAVARLRELVAAIEQAVVGRAFTGAELATLARSVVEDGVNGEYRDYAAAEQAAMALGSLIHAMEVAGTVSEARLAELNAALDGIYAVLENDEQYQPTRLVGALRALQGKL